MPTNTEFKLPPIIMTPEEIEAAEEQCLETAREWLNRHEQEQKQRKIVPSKPSVSPAPVTSKPLVGEFQPSDELLTKHELAARLQAPLGWIYEQTRERSRVRSNDPLPVVRLTPKKLRFNWREVCAWMSRQRKVTS